MIFEAAPKDLFAGLNDRVEAQVRKQASRLIGRLESRAQSPVLREKLTVLRNVARRDT
jgi:hypothetical protein